MYFFGSMKHILKQLHYVRCPALALFCDSLCGSLAKKFGDPVLNDNLGARLHLAFPKCTIT